MEYVVWTVGGLALAYVFVRVVSLGYFRSRAEYQERLRRKEGKET